MKKIITTIIVIISLNASAQRLDTVLVRNLQMAAYDWCLFDSRLQESSDSLAQLTHRRIRTKIQQVNPANYNVLITVDSLPGVYVMAFYQAVQNWPAGEIAARYNTITTAISGKANLSYWVGLIDGVKQDAILRARNKGKFGLIDN